MTAWQIGPFFNDIPKPISKPEEQLGRETEVQMKHESLKTRPKLFPSSSLWIVLMKMSESRIQSASKKQTTLYIVSLCI